MLLLSERMAVMQREMSTVNTRVDRVASEQATIGAIKDLTDQIKALQSQAEGRIRPLEDWKNGINAQIKLAYAFAAVCGALAGVVGHYWR